jgi:hypothetical protein
MTAMLWFICMTIVGCTVWYVDGLRYGRLEAENAELKNRLADALVALAIERMHRRDPRINFVEVWHHAETMH